MERGMISPPSDSFANSSKVGSLNSLTLISVHRPTHRISDFASLSLRGVISIHAISCSRVLSLLCSNLPSFTLEVEYLQIYVVAMAFV